MTTRWPNVPLGEILTARQEKPSEEDLLSGRVRIVSKIPFANARIQFRSDVQTKTPMILVRPGDLLVSGINAHKGAIAIYDSKAGQPAAATIHYSAYAVSPDHADPLFLWYLLRRGVFRENLERAVPGGIKTELKASRLLRVPIPLPPLAEQRRIVARIEELAARIEEARGLHRQAADGLESLLSSVLKHFPEPVDGWQTKLIWDCSTMSTGTTPPSHRDDYYGGGLQWYTPGDLAFGKRLGRSSRTVSDRAVAEGKVRLFEPGTVLLVAIGASLGKVGLAQMRCSSNQQITGVKFSPEILPEYGFWWMRRLYNDLRAAAPQATLPIINQRRIGEFEIAIPPFDVQRRIVAHLDDLQTKVDALKGLQAETAVELDALLPSVLDKAFKGEL